MVNLTKYKGVHAYQCRDEGKIPIPLEEARLVAERVVSLCGLRTLAKRYEIAGSIRRGKPLCGDIDIVFESEDGVVNGRIDELLTCAVWERMDAEVSLASSGLVVWLDKAGRPKWGQKMRSAGIVHNGQVIAVQLHRCVAANWGNILAIRTGPSEYSKALVSGLWKYGLKQQDGFLMRDGLIVPCLDESSFFHEIGHRWVEPGQRVVPQMGTR